MANVVRDPKEHPDAILPDFSKVNPPLTVKKEDVAFVYGSKWKQRYFKKDGDDFYVLPSQWDVINQVWRPYFVKDGTDWWTFHYPPDNAKRPTGLLCDGCHSVNYDITKKNCHGVERRPAKSAMSRAANTRRIHRAQALSIPNASIWCKRTTHASNVTRRGSR